MRKTVAFVALWFAAGAAATTVAWLGVSTVSDQLAGSGSHPDPLSADEVSAELAAGPSTTSTTIGDATTSTSTTSTTTPIDPTATTTPGSSGTTTPVSPSTTTTAPSPSAVTKTYDLVGGTATLRFASSGVTVVVATPAAGFTVEISETHGNGVRVEFESNDHRSRLEGWWDGGPQDAVEEDD